MAVSILFNIPLVIGDEGRNIGGVIINGKFSGDGRYTEKCNSWLENHCRVNKVLLTTSCTHALEMTSIFIRKTLYLRNYLVLWSLG